MKKDLAMAAMSFEALRSELLTDVESAACYEGALSGKKNAKKRPSPRDPASVARDLCSKIQKARARAQETPAQLPTDEELSDAAEFTDAFALHAYRSVLRLVPRLVNVVTLAEAHPVAGCRGSLPLDLQRIAARCSGSFYAPQRFSAVQLAFSSPRSRVLIFHTGRLVGTGTAGAASARCALQRAQRALAEEAGIFIELRSFAVINQVGAAALGATLSCDRFAASHSSSAHYDARSFVGLAWRPPKESICARPPPALSRNLS